ncbi:hypothetical protein BLGI_1813 [Brevibacillus laterosporus GI-9]|nr:hypothetical protein BLGI_1813 [Brevibacillus laterosporus GI-9]
MTARIPALREQKQPELVRPAVFAILISIPQEIVTNTNY